MVLGGVTIYFSNTLHPPRSQTRLSNGRESHLPSRGGWGIEIIFHYPTPNEKPNEMLVHHLDSAAPSCILWIHGYDGAVQQIKRDTGDVMYNHTGGSYPTHQTAAMVEDMMPGMLRMRFQEWDPGEMNTYSEMYLPEVSMAKEVIRGHVG